MEIKHGFGFVLTMTQMIERFSQLVKNFRAAWTKALSDDPARFEELEQAALALGREIAGWLIALVLMDKRVRQSLEQSAATIAQNNADRVRNGYRRYRSVKLLTGHTIEMKALYCAPRKGKGRKAKTKRGQEGQGLYPEFAALGISEGSSPALLNEVGWLGTQLPSFEKTKEGFIRRGVELSKKGVRTLLMQLVLMTLNARQEQLEAWREDIRKGKPLPGGGLYKGKRIAVQIDGGRLKIRKNKKGPRGKKGQPYYYSDWREPKLFVIYEIDEKGRIDRSNPSHVEGTLLSSDHLMELLAFRLSMLGAAEADQIVFLADGADWIWDRIDKVIETAKLPPKRCKKVLDLAHAMSNLHKALETVKGWSPETLKRENKRLRKWLLRGEIDNVLTYLNKLKAKGKKKDVKKCIKYFERRRHLLNYAACKRDKLPMGSGAVESAIRRVINLRLKGPGIHWTKKMAEGMLCLRAQVLTGRWEEHLRMLKEHGKRSRRRNYEWTPPPMSTKAA